MSIKVYVEGGGGSKALRSACRKGFKQFLERAGFVGRMPSIVACGGRQQTYDRFSTRHDAGEDTAILLVDAEGPVTASGPWDHLKSLDGLERPEGATDDQCHLMVQIMESWFLADRRALTSFFRQGVRESALPGKSQIERIPKDDVLSALSRATRQSQKGRYDKGAHSFEILGALDPATVASASPHCKRFLDVLHAAVA